MPLRIACDLEGVLSDTHRAAYERSDNLEHCYPPTWRSDDWDYDEFMHVSQNLWHNHNEQIPTTVDGVAGALDTMMERHEVDIVTHRHNVDEQIEAWLARYNIPYNELHSPSEEKDELNYDVYIDDKPALAERIAEHPNKVIFVPRHPYNEHLSNRGNRRLSVVKGVREAAFFLDDPFVINNINQLTDPSLCGSCCTDINDSDVGYCTDCIGTQW